MNFSRPFKVSTEKFSYPTVVVVWLCRDVFIIYVILSDVHQKITDLARAASLDYEFIIPDDTRLTTVILKSLSDTFIFTRPCNVALLELRTYLQLMMMMIFSLSKRLKPNAGQALWERVLIHSQDLKPLLL